ncbi:MAG TPA: peptide chain release factor N(5)-glutamine methyltransferase [Albitalea sp.]|nr:peptide chain release factor N(5)-glutamine methyltransferase [Albitalea sp.]
MKLTVAQALAEARERAVDRLDAQLLLAAVLRRSRAWLLAHDDAPLGEEPSRAFRGALARRAAGEPLAYILGEKEFHGLMLKVDDRVLVPRPDTETLVDWALELLGGDLASVASPCVIDLGTGSGAIALAIKRACPRAQVSASDASDAALALARANGETLGLEVDWRAGSWWQAVPGQRFQLAVSNPPYIAEGDPHLDALVHEPPMALTSGPHGLEAIREIVSQAPGRLHPGGWLLLEHGHDQAPAVRALLAQAGFVDLQSRADLAGIERCSGGRRASSVTPGAE